MSLADDHLALAKRMVNYQKNDLLDSRLRRAMVNQADQAFTDWNQVSGVANHTDVCELFLAAILLGDRWKK
jgi:hypothetical protein